MLMQHLKQTAGRGSGYYHGRVLLGKMFDALGDALDPLRQPFAEPEQFRRVDWKRASRDALTKLDEVKP
jgi:hypothetical protein